uniref:C2H2-type domain-containing protein n=1 Tax=Esox lucius TaxID=8010 RepID=A0AAY5JY26_ESOLU
MAQGWNACFHKLQPLSSDSRSLNVPLDSEESLAHHLESLIEHNDMSNTVASPEKTSDLNMSSSIFSNSNTSSEFVQQKYFDDVLWQDEGQPAHHGDLFKHTNEQEPLVLSECYSEPLSFEDSVSYPKDNQEKGENGFIHSSEFHHKEGDSSVDNIEDEMVFEDQAVRLKSSLSMRKRLKWGFKCNYCPSVYAYSSGRYRHMRKHTLLENPGKKVQFRYSNLAPISKQSKESVEEPKNNPLSSEVSIQHFPCCFCGKMFNAKYPLKKHIHSMHRGDKPYRCLECGKRFSKEVYLVTHKKVHQRRIQCTVCKKILPTIGELIQHRQTHIKRGICGTPFHRKEYLLLHHEKCAQRKQA